MNEVIKVYPDPLRDSRVLLCGRWCGPAATHDVLRHDGDALDAACVTSLTQSAHSYIRTQTNSWPQQ